MSFWVSPYGPLGRAKGLFIWMGASAFRSYEGLLARGFSRVVAGGIIFVVALVCVLAIVFVLAMFGGDEQHAHAA
jgi:hypothetical protein